MKTSLLTSIICSFLFLNLHAQDAAPDSWIKPSPVDEQALPVAKKAILNKIKAMEGYENPVMIDVKSIASSVAKDGSLSFNMPGSMQTLMARSRQVDAASEETYTWMGEFEDDMGSMTVVSDQGKVRAHFSYDDEAYEIFPVD